MSDVNDGCLTRVEGTIIIIIIIIITIIIITLLKSQWI